MRTSQPTQEKLLTTDEVAEIIGYSVQTLKNWRSLKTPDTPKYRKQPGKRGSVRYPLSALLRWMKRREIQPVSLKD